MEKETKNRGITLIALVITIIVLLILAGISIATLTGENGILTKSNTAKKETEKATAKERIQIEVLGSYDNNGKLIASKVIENITKNIPEAKIEGDDFPLRVTLDGYTFEIDGNGNVNLIGPTPQISDLIITLEDGTTIPEEGVAEGTKLKISFTTTIEGGIISGVTPGTVQNGQVTYVTTGTEKEVKFTITGQVEGENYTTEITISLEDKYQKLEAGVIAKSPQSYYGSIVTGYSAGTGVSTWRIYYADSDNIYLIADDYISKNDIPNTPSGKTLTTGATNWRFVLTNAVNDTVYSTGSAWISANSKAKKWLSKYLAKNPKNTNDNIKAVAYLMDTNIWSKYLDDNLAEYAIGGPTIELFCVSYKDTHPEWYIECMASDDSIGYKVKWSDRPDTAYSDSVNQIADIGGFNGIYMKENTDAESTIWLASPSARTVYFVGILGDSYTGNAYGGNRGLRPIVCLKPGIQLEKVSEGTYAIKNKSE